MEEEERKYEEEEAERQRQMEQNRKEGQAQGEEQVKNAEEQGEREIQQDDHHESTQKGTVKSDRKNNAGKDEKNVSRCICHVDVELNNRYRK